jgi:hypothetical protein
MKYIRYLRLKKENRQLRARIERLEAIATRIFRLMCDRDNWENFTIHATEWKIWGDEFGVEM